jgi:PKD repeat protein
MCAVMVMVAMVPLASGGEYKIVKGPKGPWNNIVTWDYKPSGDGVWKLSIDNSRLAWMQVDVYDSTTSTMEQVLRQKIIFDEFGAFPTGHVFSDTVNMEIGHKYTVTAMGNGPISSYASVSDMFFGNMLPVAAFEVTMDRMTAMVNAAGSYDPDGTIVSYAWDWGDGTTGTDKIAQHTYEVPDEYRITLTVTDNNGATGSAWKMVTAGEPQNQNPSASFTVDIVYLEVTVDASASKDPDGTILAYDWDFGDGGSGTGVKKTHTYASAGTYTIKLTVTDNGGKTGTLSQPVTVVANPPPTAVITVVSQDDPQVGLSGASSTDDSAVVSYTWNFGDSQTATGKDVTHDYAAAGTYTITLTVTDDFGLTGSATKIVTVTVPVPVTERLHKVYDMFEQPWGQWWTDPIWGRWVSYGTDIMLSYEPHMRTMVYMPGVDLNHAYQGVIYAPYRYQVDARNVTNLNIGKPEFMPVQNPSASSAGASAKIDLYWEYLDQTWWDNYWLPVWGTDKNFPGGNFFPGADDGYYIGTIYNITMNRQAALKWLNMPTSVNPVTWWGDPAVATSNAALYNKAWIAWVKSEANSRVDIYNSYASLYYAYGAYMKLTTGPGGEIKLQIGHISFGFECLQVKWMKDANLSPHECYMEDYSLNATYTEDKAWVKADGVCEYSLKAEKANQTTSTPAWVFEADRIDYVGSSTKHPYSEYDPYVGLTYMSWNAGDTFYGQYVPYDATPGWLNLSDHDKLTVQLPTGTVPGYKPVALTPADYDNAIAGDLSGFTGIRQDGVFSLGYSVTNPANPLNLVPLYNTATKTLVIKGPYNFDNVLNPAATSPNGARYHGAPWIEFNVGPAAATMSVDTSSSGASVVDGSASSETSIVAALVSVAMLSGLMGAVVIGLGRKEPEPEAT